MLRLCSTVPKCVPNFLFVDHRRSIDSYKIYKLEYNSGYIQLHPGRMYPCKSPSRHIRTYVRTYVSSHRDGHNDRARNILLEVNNPLFNVTRPSIYLSIYLNLNQESSQAQPRTPFCFLVFFFSNAHKNVNRRMGTKVSSLAVRD